MKRVKNVEENNSLVNKGIKVVKKIGIGGIIVLALLNVKEANEALSNKKQENSMAKTTSEILKKETNENIDTYEYPRINYDRASDLYNKIREYKTTYGENFAKDINSEEDIISLIAFVNSFNEMYRYEDNTSEIGSREEFESIIYDYYSSCIKCGIKPNLSDIFNNSYCRSVLSDTENLMYQAMTNKDAGSVENYLRCINDYCNFYQKEKAIDLSSKVNAPLIDIIDMQLIAVYDNNVGNIWDIYRIYTTKDLYPETEEICPQALIDTLNKERNQTLEVVLTNIDNQCSSIKKTLSK